MNQAALWVIVPEGGKVGDAVAYYKDKATADRMCPPKYTVVVTQLLEMGHYRALISLALPSWTHMQSGPAGLGPVLWSGESLINPKLKMVLREHSFGVSRTYLVRSGEKWGTLSHYERPLINLKLCQTSNTTASPS